MAKGEKILLSENSPILDIQGNTTYCSNGDVIVSFKCDLPEVYSSSEKKYDEIHSIWTHTLKNFMDGCAIHKQDFYKKSCFDSSNMEDSNFMQKSTKDYFHGREYVNHRSDVHFILLKNRTILNNDRISNPLKKVTKEANIETIEKNIKQFRSEILKAVDYINSSRLINVQEYKTIDLWDNATYYFNGMESDLYSDTYYEDGELKTGNKLIGVLSVHKAAQFQEGISNIVKDADFSEEDYSFYRGSADRFGFNINCDHIFNQVFFIESKQRIKESIKSKTRSFLGSRGFDQDNQVAADNLKELQTTMAKDNTLRFIYAHFNVVYFSDNSEQKQLVETQLTTEFKNIDIKPYSPKGKQLMNLFINSSFCTSGNLDRDNTFAIDVKQASCLITNVTNYKDDVEGIIFNDRVFNIPVIRDVWDKQKVRIKARNFFVNAPTGEGKSFLVNHILRQFFEQMYNIVICDLGGSYEKLSLLYPELKDQITYVRYREGESLGINPFFVTGLEELTTEKINEIVDFIRLPWKRSAEMSDEESTSLRLIVKHYYQNHKAKHSFPSFYHFIESNQKNIHADLKIQEAYFDIASFLHMCREFVGDGAYSFLLKEEEQDEFKVEDKRMVIFEFDEAKGDPLLLSCLLQLSYSTIKKIIWRDRVTRGIVLFDEFAKMLEFDDVLSQVKFYSQAIRKQESALGLVLQTPHQLPDNEISDSIIENTQVFYSLTNRKGYEVFKSRFNYEEHEIYQLRSLRNNFTGKRKYSEIHLKMGGYSNVVRLEVPYDVYLAYQTEGDEHTKLMELYKTHGDMEMAINHYQNNTK